MSRGWIFSTLVTILSTKRIIDRNESRISLLQTVLIYYVAFPLTLTALQMTFCAVAIRFLPRFRLRVTVLPVEAKDMPLGILIAGVVICFNCAYVDLPISLIEILKVSQKSHPLMVSLEQVP